MAMSVGIPETPADHLCGKRAHHNLIVNLLQEKQQFISEQKVKVQVARQMATQAYKGHPGEPWLGHIPLPVALCVHKLTTNHKIRVKLLPFNFLSGQMHAS